MLNPPPVNWSALLEEYPICMMLPDEVTRKAVWRKASRTVWCGRVWRNPDLYPTRVRGMTHVTESQAGDSVGRNVRIVQSPLSLDVLSSVRPVISYFYFFLSFSMTNIILGIFLIVETCANLPDPFLFFTEVWYSFRGLFLMITVSTARWALSLAVRAPSFDMWPLRTMDEESRFAGTMPKNEANLSELWNLFISPI